MGCYASTPIIHKGKFISFSFKGLRYWSNSYKLTFLDSYLILPASLKDLCYSFQVVNPKGISEATILFNDIDYKGNVPEFK